MRMKCIAACNAEKTILNLSYQGIEDKDIPIVLDVINEYQIPYLNLHKNYITTKGVQLIVKNPCIKKLNLALNRIDAEGIELLKNSSIENIEFDGNPILDENKIEEHSDSLRKKKGPNCTLF